MGTGRTLCNDSGMSLSTSEIENVTDISTDSIPHSDRSDECLNNSCNDIKNVVRKYSRNTSLSKLQQTIASFEKISNSRKISKSLSITVTFVIGERKRPH